MRHRALSVLVSMAMAVSMVPSIALADGTQVAEQTTSAVSTVSKSVAPGDMTVLSNRESTLAPGVTQNQVVVYDADGNRVQYYVAEADMSVDTVGVYCSYRGMDNSSYGMSKLTEQVSSFNKSENYQGMAVAAMNASYYNMTTGKPLGAFVMQGNDVTTESEGNQYPYFAVMKDGSVKIGKKGEYSSDKGNIQEAVSIYTMLVQDGEIVAGTDAQTKYPRSTVGITAEGKVVIMSADGNQAPKSSGLTKYEQAEVMRSLGCVVAGELDGGGSATYGSKAEGASSFAIENNPSDGSERSISNGLIIASTAVDDGSFDHAALSAENEYVTPGTATKVSVTGATLTGNKVDVPADVTYAATGGTFENGVFTAGDSACEGTVTAYYNGKAVGSTTIHVVVPTAISFDSEKITIPYGASTTIGISATYNSIAVATKASDFAFSLSDPAAATIDGLSIKAGDNPEISSATIQANLALNPSVTATAELAFGKGSETLLDFEDGKCDGAKLSYTGFNYYLPRSSVGIATAENGQVHSGKHSLALNIDYSNSLESGYQMTALYLPGEHVIENAKTIGMWMYIPDDYVGLWGRWVLDVATTKDENGNWKYTRETGQLYDGKNGATGVVSSFSESGWHYVSIDVSKYRAVRFADGDYCFQFYISDRDGASYNYYFKNQHNVNGNFTVYVDDVTVDYSSVIDDREAPVFGDAKYAMSGMSDAAVLKDGASIAGNSVDFSAAVGDDTTKGNATGIDPASAKAYVDGNEVPATYSGGIISMDSAASLSAGSHSVKFSICDKQGNKSSIKRNVEITSGEAAPIKVVAHDPNADRVLLGSVNYVDIVANDASSVQSVTTKLNLDSMSKWELDHMSVASGFKASYSLDSTTNDVVLTIDRVGGVSEQGELVLASIPVRAWTLNNSDKVNPSSSKEWTLAEFKASKEFWPIAIDLKVDQGTATSVDGAASSFAGDGVFIWTEMWANYGNMVSTAEGKAYFDSWNGGHVHSAAALPDKAATCTEKGYAGRTYCDGCDSVIDWGQEIDALGHSYALVDGVAKCSACGNLLTGSLNGKDYVNGELVKDGWTSDGEAYYVDGAKLTGVKLVEKPDGTESLWYDFGEDGTCQGAYTGLYYDEGAGVYRYAVAGTLSDGWKQVDDEWYLFSNGKAKVGELNNGTVTYSFEQTGRLVSGIWYDDGAGMKYYYGPSFYRNHTSEIGVVWAQIDGKTYGFDQNGHRYEGLTVAQDSTRAPRAYLFDESGVFQGESEYTGTIERDGSIYYVENGVVPGVGLVRSGDGYYFVLPSGKVAVDSDRWISSATSNGLLPNGNYHFGADGRLVQTSGVVDVDGTLYYYETGSVQGGKGLVEVDGSYYYVLPSGKVAVNSDRAVPDGLLPAGTYRFGADGKLAQGATDVDGTLYYLSLRHI